MMKKKTLTIPISDKAGAVSAEIIQPADMKALLVLAHGAGAGMNHSFMTHLAEELANLHVGTLRYNFVYMEKGSKRPDPPAIAAHTVQQVIDSAHALFPDVPLFAGGKSFGGRMTTQYASRSAAAFLKGIILFGFPLHPAGAPATIRGEHLKAVTLPMLFLQGTRDTLAELSLIQQVTSALPLATCVLFDGADHSFKSGKKDLVPSLALAVRDWMEKKDLL